MTLLEHPLDGGNDGSGHFAPAARGVMPLSRSISQLRAGHRSLSAMLMRLFDELDHRRLQLAEQSRSLATRRATASTDAGASRGADQQIAALERALAAAQTQHAQRLAEFAVTRIELAAARIELTKAAGSRAADDSDSRDPEPDTLSAELEMLRSSAVELARELSGSRQRGRIERAGENLEYGSQFVEGDQQNAQLQRIARLLDATEAGEPGSSRRSKKRRSGAGDDQLPELLE